MTRNKNRTGNIPKVVIPKNEKPPPPTGRGIPDPPSNSQTTSGSFLSTIVQGFSFGSGSALAHQGVNTILNGNNGNNNGNNGNNDNNDNNGNNCNNDVNNTNKNRKCLELFQMYQECLDKNFDKEMCRDLEKQVHQCMELS